MGMGGVARSVHVADAFVWRGMKGMAAVRPGRRGKGLGRRAPAYPPPIVAAPPRSTNEVLSGLSDVQWAAFVGQLRERIGEALREGRWATSGPNMGTVAMSLPY
jgi:hypothetical protein